MKRKDKKLVFILACLLISLALGYLSLPTVRADSTIHYNFNNEILYNKTELNYTDIYNVRHPVVYTDYYNATYGFTDDLITSDWTKDETGGTVLLLDNFDGHNNVIVLDDTSVADGVDLYQTFTAGNQEYGTIEFYMQTNDTSDTQIIWFGDGGIGVNRLFYIYFGTDGIFFRDGATASKEIDPAYDNQWYHMRIDFECTAGSYMGLSQYTYDAYVNGFYLDNFDFENNHPHMDTLYFEASNNAPLTCKFYLDSLGYSWNSDYDVSDNIIPHSYENTEYYEGNKYLFDFDANDELYDDYDNPDTSKFTTSEPDGDNIYILNVDNERVVEFNHDGDTGGGSYDYSTLNTAPTNYASDGQKIVFNFTLEFKEIYYSATAEYAILRIVLRCHNTLQNGFNLYFEAVSSTQMELYYLDDTSSWSLLTPTLFNINERITLESTIIYDTDMCVMNYYNDYQYNETIVFNLAYPTGKDGIKYIQFQAEHYDYPTQMTLQLYEISCYVDGITSFTSTPKSDLCGLGYDINSNWDFSKHNLATINLANNITSSIVVFNDDYLNESLLLEKDRVMLSDIDYLDNGYESTVIYNSKLFCLSEFLLNNELFFVRNFTLNQLYVRGCSIIESSNTYWLSYVFNNVDMDDSYFYIDSLNRLWYNLTTNDNNTEYIRTDINIVDVSTDNRFLSYQAYLFGQSAGTLIVEYSTVSSIHSFEQLDKSYYQILREFDTVNKFIVEISDNDLYYEGHTLGYILNIKLRYTELSTTIISLVLSSLIVPLIIMLVPSLALSGYYSENLLVPLFLLMAIICAFTYIIPMWLFFIIAFSLVVMMFLEREQLEGGFM